MAKMPPLQDDLQKSHWDDPEGWDGEGGGRRESGWGTHVNPWLICVSVWQNHYNIVN